MTRVTRRGFVGTSLAGAALPPHVWTQRSNPVPEDFRPVSLRPEIRQRILNRWRDMKAFEPQWRDDYRNLYRLAGIDLAVEDVGHFHEPSFRAGLQHTARAGFVYDKIKTAALRVSGVDDLESARRDEKVAVLLHLHGANGSP